MRLRCAVALACVATGCALAQRDDGGGRDVSIALFSTRRIESVTMAAIGAAWTASCAQCAHRALTQPLHMTGEQEIFAGGALRVTDDATGAARAATGLWHLRANGGNGIDVVLTIPSERYVVAVLDGEAAPDEPVESLRALAILARTYELNGRHFSAAAGHLAADLCDSTECQALQLRAPSRGVEEAAESTAGETLWFGGHRAEVFFSQNCGGLTEDAGAVWPRLRGLPYLASHRDAYCPRRDAAEWRAEVPLAALTQIAQLEGWHLPDRIVFAEVVERSNSRRAERIRFNGWDGKTADVSASALRFGLGRSLGWNRVRSDAYQLTVRNGELIFAGHGHGHGVGLCQTGATEMAREGKSAPEILANYFPGTAVHIAPADDGWREERAGSLILRSAQKATAARKIELEDLWSEAQKRFPPHTAITPHLVFAPSTELFRQLTSQPGWMLAVTRGSTIVFQPEGVLRAQKRDEHGTIRHEMLHVLVETECRDTAPLWLREGLVEALSGGRADLPAIMPIDTVEDALRHPTSQKLSARAHWAAATRVRALIARYGLSTVRGWLSSGVPAGVS